MAIYKRLKLTGVSAMGKNRKFLIILQRAIFNSSIANRIPTQLRGPIPKGTKAYWFGLMSLSGSHLLISYNLMCCYNIGT